MVDSRFFQAAGPFDLARLAHIAEAELAEGADPSLEIRDVAPLEQAGPHEISFLDNKRYVEAFAATGAGACVIQPSLVPRAPPGTALLLSDAPYRSYALIAQAFYPKAAPTPGVAGTAMIDATATVDSTSEIGPGVIVGAAAWIGARCRIAANAVIGAGVVLGDDCEVGACASLSHCLIGRRVVVYPGARIGQEGFGFAMDRRGHVRVPQLGRVIIEDEVEIGANVTIDRGAGPDTIVRRGCMIDNLVQIAHNVDVGPGSVIVAQAGIAGSTKLGSFAVIAGQAGIGGHLKIGPGARVAAAAAVMRDVPPGEEVCGVPAIPIRDFWRRYAKLTRLIERKG